ncbi:MAG: hypothetical protein H5T49_05860 [Hadesarchaea archaeon]|nr:hypothetical protein [Hadesarchaea archaeon]
MELCDGDIVLVADEEQTYLYPVAPLPANREGDWKPIKIAGHYRKWGFEQWQLLKEIAANRFAELYPEIAMEIERAKSVLTDPNASRITKIEIKTGKEVFGLKASNPDRPIAIVWTENGARLVLTIPLGTRYQDDRWIVFDPEAFKNSIENERSMFGAFFKRYRRFPRVGMIVKTTINSRGYWTIEC